MSRTVRMVLGWVFAAGMLAGCSDTEVADFPGEQCSLDYNLPADIPASLADTSQSDFEQYSWQSFLALNAPTVGGEISLLGDNETQWRLWSSTVDLIECNIDPSKCVCPDGDCAQSGARYYPDACRDHPDFGRYRVIAGIDKADDLFLEAKSGGLSNDPVIDSQGRFLRYEIVVSPAMYRDVVSQGLYDWDVLENLESDVLLQCGNASYTGGDPANPAMGALLLKIAWMEGGLPGERYHTENVLVYSPSYRNSDGVESCELKTLAMVGMHLVHKTVKQPNWTWATFEHTRNAPDCSGLPPAGMQDPLVNVGCPSSVSSNWNFAPAACADGQCATCNASPTSNAPADSCRNPDTPSDEGWCLDLPPAADAGYSYLCRQAPVSANYPEANAWNNACQLAIGDASVWSQYDLIATQWLDIAEEPTECENNQAVFSSSSSREAQLPQIDVAADPGGTEVSSRPWLGNSSMESYERSNCNACHAKTSITTTSGDTVNTDFMYWLTVETCAAWCEANDVDPCTCLSS